MPVCGSCIRCKVVPGGERVSLPASVDQSHQGMSHFLCLAQSRAGMYIQNISSDLHSEMALFGVPQT